MGLVASVAHAETTLPGAVLKVNNSAANAACVSEEALASRVRGQVGQSAATARKPTIIEVRISSNWSGLVARLLVHGQGEGVREIEAARCQGLLDALSVTIAMLLDPSVEQSDDSDATATVTDPTSSVAIPPPSPTAKPPRSAPKVESSHSPRATSEALGVRMNAPNSGWLRLGPTTQLRAWLGAGYGTPRLAQFESGLALYLGNWGLQLGGYFQPTSTTTLGTGSVTTMSIGGILAGCWQSGREWRGQLCLRGAFGGKRVTGEGFERAAPARVLPVIHAGPALGIESGRRWILGIELLGLVSAWSDSYVLANSGDPSSVVGASASAQHSAGSPAFSAWLVARVALASAGEPY